VNAYELEQMNARIATPWRKANAYETIPVQGPPWSAAVLDADGELVAIHRETAAPYPLDVHRDLQPEDRAVVVARRILAAGGTAEEVVRFLDAFELPQYARDRLVRQLREATS
jgi:hypothetical protein